MSLSRSVLIVAGLLSLAGCGFEPIAAPVNPSAGDEASAIRLRDVSIGAEDSRFEFQVRRGVDRQVILDDGAPATLRCDTRFIKQDLAIEQNDTVTRRNLIAETTYRLIGPTGETIRDGKFRTITAVNATTELYATQVSRDEAMSRLAEETARRLVTLLRIENQKEGSLI